MTLWFVGLKNMEGTGMSNHLQNELGTQGSGWYQSQGVGGADTQGTGSPGDVAISAIMNDQSFFLDHSRFSNLWETKVPIKPQTRRQIKARSLTQSSEGSGRSSNRTREKHFTRNFSSNTPTYQTLLP